MLKTACSKARTLRVTKVCLGSRIAGRKGLMKAKNGRSVDTVIMR